MSNLKTIIYILSLALVFGCSSKPEKLAIDRMNIEIEIIPEDLEGGYSISWKDTLCSEFESDLDYLEKRPFELNCYITNKSNDTLGYYGPQSSQQQFAYFQCKDKLDSIINLNFKVNLNPFSTFLHSHDKSYIDNFIELNKEQIFFESIQMNLSSVLREKLEIELEKTRHNKK